MKPTRKQVLALIYTAGAENDIKAYTRLYIENRISLKAAKEAFEAGRKFGAFVRQRDAGKT